MLIYILCYLIQPWNHYNDLMQVNSILPVGMNEEYKVRLLAVCEQLSVSSAERAQ